MEQWRKCGTESRKEDHSGQDSWGIFSRGGVRVGVRVCTWVFVCVYVLCVGVRVGCIRVVCMCEYVCVNVCICVSVL